MFKKRHGEITASQTALIIEAVILVLFALIAAPLYTSYQKRLAVNTYKVVYAALQQGHKMYTLTTSEQMNVYNTNLSAEEFAKTYFTPYLQLNDICDKDQKLCWNTPYYKDLRNKKIQNPSTYSIVLANRAVLGFHKNKDGLISIIVDTNGKAGANRLGRDIFVFSFYNNEQRPNLCDKSVYDKVVNNGLHTGGYNKCGIPHDAYDYQELTSGDVYEACNKKAPTDSYGQGTGSACGALLKINNWVMDKKYPW